MPVMFIQQSSGLGVPRHLGRGSSDVLEQAIKAGVNSRVPGNWAGLVVGKIWLVVHGLKCNTRAILVRRGLSGHTWQVCAVVWYSVCLILSNVSCGGDGFWFWNWRRSCLHGLLYGWSPWRFPRLAPR